MGMFCYQCQETAKNEGCTVRGVCGKSPEVAMLQDLLIWTLKGISWWGINGRGMGVSDSRTNLFVAEALFATITNANFDDERFVSLIQESIELRDALKQRAQAACESLHGKPCFHALPEAATWHPENWEQSTLLAKAARVGIMADPDLDEDIRSLREMLVIGLKGMAAYLDHAYVLDHHNEDVLTFLQEGLLATINDNLSVEDMVGWVVRCGKMGAKAMALLDEANTNTYGHPEPTDVRTGVVPGKAILISGHDLRDLHDLLEQTRGTGINVYTHGEMLPAHAYPAFKEYDNLIGNYGGSWWHQASEFESFGGAILMTTNCLIKPRDSYVDRLFTTGMAGWPGVTHIANRVKGGQKDFSAVIAAARAAGEPVQIEDGLIPIGYAHNTVVSNAGAVLDAVQAGAVKRFVVMAGCDARSKSRDYYTQVAQALPEDTIILTAGCAKYRYNKLNLGKIGPFPRVLDAGQCNDSYSLVVIAMKLAEALGLDDVNDLPISYDIAWYEQKAVIVLLALLALGVKKIRLGPTLPAFASPNVRKVLVEQFGLMTTDGVEEDVAAMMRGE